MHPVSEGSANVCLMRILHTSDWHIGRTLHGVDLLQHHATYFDHLVDLVGQEGIDAVVVSGDIYDRAIPPVDAVELLSETLARLSEKTQIVVTPGNHDSAIRLGFGASLMRPSIHIRSLIRDIARPVELVTTNGEELLVYALPYLDPDAARPQLSEDSQGIARSHEAVMSAAMSAVRSDLSVRESRSSARPASLVMAHAFVVGGQPSESERDIRIGGVDSVPSGVFDGVDYVALGHLHGPQAVKGAGSAVARYSGSPLAFSFSEMNHKKSSALVEIGKDGVLGEPQLFAAPVPRKLSEVSGTMDELLGATGEKYVDDWLRVYVTDQRRPQEMNARLKARFPHALVMQHRPVGVGETARAAITVTQASNPAEVASRFIEDVTLTPPTPQERKVLEDAMDLARAQEKSA